jgi:hypothetical protein
MYVWKVTHEDDDGLHLDPEYYQHRKDAVERVEELASTAKWTTNTDDLNLKHYNESGYYGYHTSGRYGYYEELVAERLEVK